jgi:hypothetical protein
MKRPKLQVSDKAKAWHAANPWFGKDIDATRTALFFHEALVEQGVEAGSDEYYELIDDKLAMAMKLGLMKEVK